MSRVFRRTGKYVNSCKYSPEVTAPSKVTVSYAPWADYHKATKLSGWLMVKYHITYKTFRRKSKARKDELRREYAYDTKRNTTEPKEELWID